MRKILLIAGIIFLAWTGTAAQRTPVLCLVSEDTATQGLDSLDKRAVEAYRELGFDLQFGFYQKTTRADLLRYPVVVGMIPQLHAGTCPISPRLAEDFDFFMKSGGGLVLIPGPSYYGVDDFIRQLNPFLSRYGVELLNEIPMDSDPANTLTQVRALAYRYLKTSALKPDHPVTRGIPFLYLPLDFSYSYVRTYTMKQPSPEWEILVTGEKGCGSFLRKSMAAGHPEAGYWKSRPPFLAVRPVGNGYLAVFTTASRFFIYDAFHWAFGEGFVLKEGNGLKLMDQLFRFVSSHRDRMPPVLPAPPAPKAKAVVVGNLPVIQDMNAWREFVMKQRMPSGFGVRYYINTGGLTDGLFSAKRGCGLLPQPDNNWIVRRPWMDIFHPTAASGRAGDQKSFRYRFERLDPAREYRIGILVWSTQPEGARDVEVSWSDGTETGETHLLKTLELPRFDQSQGPSFTVLPLPRKAYSDGTLTLDFRRGPGGAGTFTLVSELWLFEQGAPAMNASAFEALFDNPAFGVALLPENRVLHKGLIGAHSPYTDGRDSVEKMVQSARENGLDFLVFTDDFAALTPEKFARLSEDCKAASRDGFRAIPGLTLTAAESGPPQYDRPQRNGSITAYFAGPIRRLPEPDSLHNPHELFWKFFGGEFAEGVRTVGNLRTPNKNAVSPFFQRFWRGLDVASLDENGRNLDDALPLYRELTAAGYGPQPRYSGVYRSAEEIRKAANRWQVQFTAPKGEELWPFLYSSGVTSGPELTRISFSSDLTRDGESGNGDIFRKNFWTVASLEVKSPSRITDVILYGGGRILRHFRPDKTEWEVHEPVRIDRQTSLYWLVKAENGTAAVSGSYSFLDERMRGNMCADNQNSICSVSRAPEGFVRDERELYLQHSYWHTGEAQGQLGVMRDARQLVPRVIESGIIQLCKFVQPMPLLRTADGREENHIFSKMSIAAASGEGNRIHYEFQVPGAKMSSAVDLTAFRPAADGDTSVLAELTVRAEQDLPAQKWDSLRVFSFGLMPSFPADWHYRVETAPGKFEEGKLSGTGKMVFLPFAPYGAAALFPNNLAEPALISLNPIPLEVRLDEVKAWNCRERLSVYLPKRDLRAGETIRLRFLMQLTQSPVDSADALSRLKNERLRRAGMVQRMLLGTLNGTEYVLDFNADKGTAAWENGAWNAKDPLPVRIRGLNPNWSALSFRDAEYQAQAVHDDGIAFFTLPAGKAAKVICGHPILADDPELRIDFAGISERGVSMRLHNPEPKRKTFTVRSNQGFAGVIPPFEFQISLNPGSGIWVTAKGDQLTIDNIR